MPRDISGVYSLPAGNPVVTSTTIASSWANTTMQDIALALTSSLSVDGSVTAAKLAPNSVTTAKILDGNVTTAKIADGAVTATKIFDGSIITAKISDSQVTTAKINNSSVTTDKLATAAVTDDKIASGAVVFGKISGNAVTTASIAADAVTYAKIQNVSSTDRLLGRVTSGSGDVEEVVCTAAGRALLDDSDVTAQRSTLGLGTMATQDATTVAITGGTISNITDLAVADGGTGASTAAGARTALGAQTQDADLDALASVSTAGILARTGAGTAAARTLAGTTNQIVVTNGDGVSGDPTMSLPSAVQLPGTLGVTGLVTLTAGQIKFPNTAVPSADANVLDDYQENTFTPLLRFETNGDFGVAFSVLEGHYTKVGGLVHVHAILETLSFAHTTASGDLLIDMPYSADGEYVGTISVEGVSALSTGYTSFHAVTVPAGPNLGRVKIEAEGHTEANSVYLDTTNFPTGSDIKIRMSITIRTDD